MTNGKNWMCTLGGYIMLLWQWLLVLASATAMAQLKAHDMSDE